jgi:protein TonB
MPSDEIDDSMVFDVRGQELIEMEEILQTRQEEKKPPPPAPLPPVVVPDDIELEVQEIEISDQTLAVEDPGTDAELKEGDTSGEQMSARSDRGPRAVWIVEPEYTRAADRRDVRAEIIVQVLVSRAGRVEEASVIERYLIDKEQTEREPVDEVGYGLEDAALDAARRWRFEPAIERGQRVQSYTTLTFVFGV